MKAPVDFASNAPDANAIDVFPESVFAPAGLQQWLLVDVALVGPERFAAFCRHFDFTAYSAYEGTQLAGFGEYSPHLIALSDDPQKRRLQIKVTLHKTREAPAVSWFASAAPLEAIQGLFGYLAKLRAEGREKPLHCRVGDVRTLEDLSKILNAAQHQRVAQILDRWHWFDRYGELKSWPLPSEAAVDADPSIYLQLSAAAFQILDADSEPDEVFVDLLESDPHYVPAQQRGDFHRRLTNCLDAATALKILRREDRFQFVVLCLEYGDDFHQLAALTNTWASLKESEVSLSTLIFDWPVSLQAALEASRPKT